MAERARLGFVGCPPEEAFATLVKRFPDAEWIDLDNFYPHAKRHSASLLPSNVCAIIKRIVDNALSLPLDAILFDEGYSKCDNARAAATVIENASQAILVRTRNDNLEGCGTPICDSGLSPYEKAERILDGITDPSPASKLEPFQPPAAIWGVPASDFNLYKLFPDGTRLLGWFRCLENKTPADEALELSVDPEVPTVFFAQAFCHKNIFAKELARNYSGLYVDMDGDLTSSIRAKVETFLHFNVA